MTDDDDDARQFTPAERRLLRKLIENDERVAWMWSSLRVWASWISAFVIGTYAVYQSINGWIPDIFKKVGP